MDSACPLDQRACVPCRGGVPPLQGHELAALHALLPPGWQVVDEHHLEKEFLFANFLGALAFANRVGALAETVNHHPDLLVAWGRARVTVWTHKINGLSEADFVLAAKADALAAP